MRNRTGPWWLALGLIALMLGPPGPVSANSRETGPNVIEAIEIQVATSGSGVHPVLLERVERAVQAVADKALRGREVQEVLQYKDQFVASLSEVYASTITGFDLQRIALLPGKVSLLKVSFRVSDQQVETITCTWEITEEMPEWVSTQIGSALGKELRKVEELFLDLPLGAYSWAGPAIQRLAVQMLPALPGFQLDLETEIAAKSRLKVRVQPEEPRIYRIEIEPDSTTLPPVLLRQLAGDFQRELNMLRGLPVEFVRANSSNLEEHLRTRLNQLDSVYKLKAVTLVGLTVDALTLAQISINSREYKFLWEGEINFGSDQDPNLRLEAGRYLSPVTRIIGGLEIPVTSLDLQPKVGVGLEWLGGDIVFLYALNSGKPLLRYEYSLGLDQRLRLERDWAAQHWEIAYGVQHTDYLTTEIVGNNSGVWFRLVGSL